MMKKTEGMKSMKSMERTESMEAMEKVEKVIPLETPVRVGDREYAELRLREPIVNEVILSARVAGNGKSLTAACDSQVDLLKRVSGWLQEALDALPVRVMDAAIAWLMEFQDEKGLPPVPSSGELELDPPLELARGERHTVLILKEPTVGQRKQAMRQLDQYGQNTVGGLEFQVTLLAEVSGWKQADVLRLPVHYFVQASLYLSGFFTNGQATGGKSNAG